MVVVNYTESMAYVVVVNYIESMAYVDDYSIIIDKDDKQVIQVDFMVNYGHEHDFIWMHIYVGLREEAKSLGFKTSTKSSNLKICIFMNPYMHIYAYGII